MVKIAIVEDEAAIASMYQTELQNAGFEIGVAGNGRAGLDLCEKMRPDLVLLDMMMPEMDGKEMLGKMRETDWGKDTLVIMLTNLSQHEAQMQMGQSKFDGYAVKAYYTPRQIRDRVVELLKENRKLPKEWTPHS